MRPPKEDSDKNAHAPSGTPSTAEGERQPPDKAVADESATHGTRGDSRDSVRSDSAVMGDEGTANTSSREKPERKPNA